MPTGGSGSVAEYLWKEYSSASFQELSWETVRSKLQECRQKLARLNNGTSLYGQYIPVPVKVKTRREKNRFAIVSYEEAPPGGIADALKRSTKKDNFAQYVGQCLLASCQGVDVSDISVQLEKMLDLSQRVQGYVRCMASHEERFPRPLANEADLPPEC